MFSGLQRELKRHVHNAEILAKEAEQSLKQVETSVESKVQQASASITTLTDEEE